MLPSDLGLTVTLRLRDHRVERVDVASSRLIDASRVLAGRDPAQVLGILPALFSLCGTAQGLAGLAAAEEALGIAVSPAQRMARRVLALVELMAEQAAGMLRDWPDFLGEHPDAEAIKPLRPLIAAARKALYPDGDWTNPGGGRLAPDLRTLADVLRRLGGCLERLLDGPVEERLDSVADFRAWTARGHALPARLLRRLEEEGLSAFGAVAAAWMPDRGPADLARRLAEDVDGGYRARPDAEGHPMETGALARRHAHALIAALTAEHGTGLVTRFAARLVDMACALREAEDLVQDLPAESGGTLPSRTDGAGLGLVDAARGLLAHHMELREGKVSSSRILAPTEWNFHPDGPLALGLRGNAEDEGLPRRARLLAAALDPCVPCRVEVSRA